MIRAKFTDPTKNFVTHGVQTTGAYTYVLLIDLAGQVLIKRINSTQSEILFTKKTTTHAEQSIADYWADPTGYAYSYIFTI